MSATINSGIAKGDNSYDSWSDITNNENITFNKEYVSAIFTVTNLKYEARKVDSNSNLEVRCLATGSISGVTGTYELILPYDKAIKLKNGDTFDVSVQLGSYNGKTVVGTVNY